jgi:hypothetical protein
LPTSYFPFAEVYSNVSDSGTLMNINGPFEKTNGGGLTNITWTVNPASYTTELDLVNVPITI